MNTHNVNVNTATPESPKTWVKTPSGFWLVRKEALLVSLARIEGELMMYHALNRAGVEVSSPELDFCPWDAADIVKSLADMGAINSSRVYDMVNAVKKLAVKLDGRAWEREEMLLPYNVAGCKADAEAARSGLIARWTEEEKPFSVDVHGETEYPEDDPAYGTFWRAGSIHLGRAWTVAEAMELAAAAWLEDEWEPRAPDECGFDSDFGRDMGPVSFLPRTIVIRDDQQRKVLTGDAVNLQWNAHVTSPAEISRLASEKEALLRDAAQESAWDNFETAKQLRASAVALTAGIVDDAWQGHPDVMAAVKAFVRPVRKTWSHRLSVKGLPGFMAEDMAFLVSLSDRETGCSSHERYELMYGVGLSMANHVSGAVSDWSASKPRLPAPVVSAWLLTGEILRDQFGDEGERTWAAVKASLKAHLEVSLAER